VVVAVGLTVTAVPLASGRLPGVITPVPPVNTPVSVALVPETMLAGVAVKLVMLAGATAGLTVTVAVCVTGVPPDGVTVSVYVVVAVGLTVTAVPLVAGRLPGVITPVPPVKTPVSAVLFPAVMVAGEAVKALIVATGTTGVDGDEPPPPQPVMATLKAHRHKVTKQNCFMENPGADKL